MAQAVLFVELVPTTKGIQRAVEKDLGGAFDATEGKAKSFWGKVAGFAGVATAAIATTAAAIAGLSIKGGISRLLNIEDAQAKLIGLGNSTETVTEIMKNALASVKGTAFGLDEAATVAASAVAAGIKPGQQLERYLRLTADAATIAGVSLSDLGGVMNNVTTLGAAYNDSLQILAGKGIPIYQWLADELGITTDAVKKLASEGKISSETFQAAIEKNISGAALTAGDTTRGAFANMLASLSRVGANLVGGVFPLFKETFQGITTLLGPLEDKAKTAGEAFGAYIVPVLEKAKTAASGLGGLITDITTTLDGLLGPLALLGAGALAPLLSGLPVIGKFLPVISGPVGLIAGAIAALIAVSPELRTALGGAFEAIVNAVGSVMTGLSPLISAVVPLVLELAKAVGSFLADAINALLPVILALIPIFAEVLSAVLPLVMLVLPLLTTLIGELAPIFSSLLSALLPILEPILALLTPLLDLVGVILPPLIELLSFLIDIVLGQLQISLGYLIPIITGVANAIGSILMPVIQYLQEYLGGLITFLTGVFSGNWDQAWSGIKDMAVASFTGIFNIGKGVINGIIDLINGMLGSIKGVAGALSDITGGQINVNIPKIPHLANGALVEASLGGSAAIIGEGRYDEAVVPLGGPQLDRIREALGSDGGGGNNYYYGDIHTQDLKEFEKAQERTRRRANALAGITGSDVIVS